MRESTRQKMLREVGWAPTEGRKAAEWLQVYVPTAVRAVAGSAWDWRCGATHDEARALGARNIRVRDGQVVADWPQFPFAVADYLDREFQAAGFEFRPPQWFMAAAASGKAGRMVEPCIPDRSEFTDSVLENTWE
jgi:hypothetical protein